VDTDTVHDYSIFSVFPGSPYLSRCIKQTSLTRQWISCDKQEDCRFSTRSQLDLLLVQCEMSKKRRITICRSVIIGAKKIPGLFNARVPGGSRWIGNRRFPGKAPGLFGLRRMRLGQVLEQDRLMGFHWHQQVVTGLHDGFNRFFGRAYVQMRAVLLLRHQYHSGFRGVSWHTTWAIIHKI